MGKTKIKTIDDSAPVEEKKLSKKKVEKAIQAKLGGSSRLSEEGKIISESTSSDVHEPDRVGTEQSEESELENRTQASKGFPTKKTQKPGKAKPRSKKYQEVTKDLDRTKSYPIPEAVEMVKKLSYAKFNATLEAHINTTQTGIRGLVPLPYAKSKKIRILAFGKDADTSGADNFGSDETIEEINKGKINFDVIITTPNWMPRLSKVAKILGPKGLMPSPKNGTITDDLKKAVEGFQAGKTEYKTEAKAALIHLGLGKLNQPTKELSANVQTLLQTLGKSKVKKVTLSPTMGPSVRVDLGSI